MTRELPILFSAPMVRAILDGRKTMTRRVLKPQPSDSTMQWLTDAEDRKAGGWQWLLEQKMTRWRPDDTLWVRETWRTGEILDCHAPSEMDQREADIHYVADGHPVDGGRWGKNRSSAVMPRWASRITLLVTDVRVERLQDISDDDCQSEGIFWSTCMDGWTSGAGADHSVDFHGRDPVWAFRKLWNRIHGPDAWERNDWVSVTKFERVA